MLCLLCRGNKDVCVCVCALCSVNEHYNGGCGRHSGDASARSAALNDAHHPALTLSSQSIFSLRSSRLDQEMCCIWG